jgi:hypothetical protein
MKFVRIVLLLALTVTLIAGLVRCSYGRIAVETIGSDFAGYWTSGRLLLQGDNPYSAENLVALQQSLGLSERGPVVIYNPPWVLTLLLPFCIPEFAPGKLMWLACTLALILYCTDRLWLIYGGSIKARACAPLVAATFSPMLFAYQLGQIVPFLLLGLVGFIYFVRRGKWWLAGMMTIFIAVKPHTIYLFWLALLMWAVKHRLWQVLLGGALALLCMTLPPLLYNPNVISQYLSDIVMKSYASYWATPTLGTFLRLLFGSQKEWLQYIPALAGLIWFYYYWRIHRDSWTWEHHVLMLIFVSLMTNFYTWPFDYITILPAVIQAAVWICQEPGFRHRGWIVLLYIMINVAAFVSTYLLSYHWYIWIPFALWTNYVLLKKQLVSNIIDTRDQQTTVC